MITEQTTTAAVDHNLDLNGLLKTLMKMYTVTYSGSGIRIHISCLLYNHNLSITIIVHCLVLTLVKINTFLS